MVAAFRDYKNVLFFDPYPYPHKPGKREYILWPAYMFQVVAPEPRPRQINLLQKHVLNFCEAGINNAQKIASFLGIEWELAGYILLELQSMAALDDDFLPTKAGKELLAEEKADNPRMVSGYVFQDPFTGKYWPRFVSELLYVDVEYDIKARARLKLGTQGKPWYENVFQVFPKNNATCATPYPEDILKIVRLHRRQYRIWKKQRGNKEIPEDREADNASCIQKIAVINRDPTSVWLATYVYLPQDIQDGACWQVCDPFGFGFSRKFREDIERRMKEDENLHKKIRDFSGSLLEEQSMQLVEMVRRMHQEASARVEDEFSIAIRDYEDLFELLVELEEANLEIKLSNRDASSGKMKSVLTKSQNVLEGVFQIIQEQFPTKSCWQGILIAQNGSQEKRYNASIISQIAFQIGFSTEKEGRLPENMVYVPFGKIKNAADYEDNHQSVNPRVIAALLTAHRSNNHPLHKAAQKFPDMLLQIHRISQLRNQRGDAHASKGEKIPFQEVLSQVEMVYRIVKTLLF